MDITNDNKEVSLPSARETESTIFEEQRLGLVSQILSQQGPTTTAESDSKSDVGDNLDNSASSKKSPTLKDFSQDSEDVVLEVKAIIDPKKDDQVEVEEVESEEESDEEEADDVSEGDEVEYKELKSDIVLDTNKKLPDLVPSAQVEKDLSEEETEDDVDLEINVAEEEAELHNEPSLNIQNNSEDSNGDINHEDPNDKPPVPIQTYLWEDVKKAKEQGGYPWTHLYKDPLGPDDEPEIILRYSQSPVNRRRKVEEQLLEGTPKLHKKVHIDDEVTVKETENYIQDLENQENGENENDVEEETSIADAAEASTGTDIKTSAKNLLNQELIKIKNIGTSISKGGVKTKNFVNNSMDRIKTMADKQIGKVTHRMHIKKIPIDTKEIVLEDPQIILKLKESPKSKKREIVSYIVKQDSDEIVEIDELDESPSETRKRREHLLSSEQDEEDTTIVPDEIIELPLVKSESSQVNVQPIEERYEPISVQKDISTSKTEKEDDGTEPTVDEIIIEEIKNDPPPKAPRKKKEHHYEDIEDYLPPSPEMKLKRQDHFDGFDSVISMLGNENIKISLQIQDAQVIDDIIGKKKHLDEMFQQSSEDEKDRIPIGLLPPVSSIDSTSSDEDARRNILSPGLLAPMSSIDSVSSDDEARRTHMSALTEESDTGSHDEPSVVEKELELTPAEEKLLNEEDDDSDKTPTEEELKNMEVDKHEEEKPLELTPAEEKLLNIQSESNIPPVEKQVELTPAEEKKLSGEEASSQDNQETEDIIVVNTGLADTDKANDQKPKIDSRWSNMSDHEYEPIGEPVDTTPTPPTKPEKVEEAIASTTDLTQKRKGSASSLVANERKLLRVPTDDADNISMEELQKQIEDRYFNMPPEPAVEDETSTAEVVGVEEKRESKMKGVMLRAQESGKNLQLKMRNQADKLKTKMSNMKTNFNKDKDEKGEHKDEPEEANNKENTAEPEYVDETAAPLKQKRKFKTPEFAKNMHMPKMNKPEFKRPEFTKISKPKMLKMPKMPKMPNMKTPDMPKFKRPDFKRPEMPKFLTEKPDFSKIKMPQKFATLTLKRSKSMKEGSPLAETASGATGETGETSNQQKKRFNMDFSTYPRLFDKLKRQQSTPASNASVRGNSPPAPEFTKMPKPALKTAFPAKWGGKLSEDTESGRYQPYNESELDMERETSVERRMRMHLERDDFNQPEAILTAEQKQLDEYDKENREIHLLSQARHDEFVRRKPPMERQESDLASEEEKQFWASALGQKIRQNIDMNSNDLDYLDEEKIESNEEREHLDVPANPRFNLDSTEQSEKDYEVRSTTPYTNQECHSSGSSSARHRKGVLEEIDDDEFFLRKKGISEDNIQMGEYITSAIKEGLTTPINALAQMGRFESYYDDDLDNSDYQGDRSDRGSRQRFNIYQQSFESDDLSHEIPSKQNYGDGFYKTFPPDRPIRKLKKSYRDDDDQELPYDENEKYDFKTEEEEMQFYDNERMKEIAHKDELLLDDMSVGAEDSSINPNVAIPPTPPRRRKKRYRDITPAEEQGSITNGFHGRSVSNTYIPNENVEKKTYHIEHDYQVPLAQEEVFSTPTPTARRSRSRSQISRLIMDDDRTSHGADSFILDSQDNQEKYVLDMYAVVRKEAPPRPPAPIRRKKSTRSLGERQFYTLPHFKSDDEPVRPLRNYSTISPNRPPRRKSISSITDRQGSESAQDLTQYEEIDDAEEPIPSALQSPPVVNKMRDRPLPPPPRPPRESRSKSKTKKYDDDDKHDFGGGAEALRVHEIDTVDSGEQVIEVEVSTQTDPVPEDFEEEYDAEVAETTSKPTKTLQDILKEEQEAELERARQLADAINLSKGIQKFRESSQKSFSERSKASKSPYGSRPETPAAILIERRVCTPTQPNSDETVTKATLVVQPISGESFDTENMDEQDIEKFEDDKYIAELVRKYVSDDKPVEKTKEKTPERQPKPVETVAPLVHETPIVAAAEPTQSAARVIPEPVAIAVEEPVYVQEEKTSVSQQASPAPPPRPVEVDAPTNEIDLEARLREIESMIVNAEPRKEESPEPVALTPVAPPRSKSSAGETVQAVNQISSIQLSRESQPVSIPEVTEPVVKGHLHLSNLEIDTLSVSSLQASKILVSELESTSISTQNMDCRTSTPEPPRSIEIPPGLIEEIVERIRTSEIQQQQQKEKARLSEKTASSQTESAQVAGPSTEADKEGAPPRPPPSHMHPQLPPFIYPEYLPFSVPPQSYFQMRNFSDDEGLMPQAPHRRRRQPRTKKDSTSEEEFQRDQRNRSRHGTRSPEPSISSLGGQLMRACGSAVRQTGTDLMGMLRASSKDENKRDLHIVLVILIVIVAGLMALGMSGGEKAVHHHHWDYFNPPGNGHK